MCVICNVRIPPTMWHPSPTHFSYYNFKLLHLASVMHQLKHYILSLFPSLLFKMSLCEFYCAGDRIAQQSVQEVHGCSNNKQFSLFSDKFFLAIFCSIIQSPYILWLCRAHIFWSYCYTNTEYDWLDIKSLLNETV